ncbi:ExbD/TolR family protein [Calycomorphotria hydatis]|uniref:Biopolymer transport protein ExbD/TolR n=1 Tax=Calycomorphotria hydatis TaxID=2528027 RepID=A0A517T6P8_9PLAN|nr:biopolymer transporter ExbD [Calycomorphotria hydatis]QDT64052.1 Biopolymer transport protein ExbD/TolR [Calycomorphotria hydatis]
MKIPRYVDRMQQGNEQAMTPMIDVVFLLLIFFVCASIGQVPELLMATELAGGDVAAETTDDEPPPLGELWIKLQRTGDVTTVELNSVQHPDLDAFEGVVRGLVEAEAASEMPAVLDIGPAVPMGDVIRAYDICASAGFATINFATDDVPAVGK